MVKIVKQHFNSLEEFYRFITTKEVNSVFKGSTLSSKIKGREDFTGTSSFEEAVDLFKYGWNGMAKKIEDKLKVEIKNIANQRSRRSVYDVVGGNCSVPRYLQGVPTAMINQKTVMKKQRVVTINKNISYNAGVNQREIIEESIKALKIVREIEATGVRVNLNIIWSCEDMGERFKLTIRVKSANERLNVSKLAFPLVHPSMLRRLLFGWLEVTDIISKDFTGGYGYPGTDEDVERLVDSNEIFLPKFVSNPQAVVDRFKNK